MRIASFFPMLAVGVTLLAPLSSSASTTVGPGTGTLQAAIDAAAPGDSLLLGGGLYVGPVVVDKRLRITCVGACVIDANCEAAIGLDIAADGVLIRSIAAPGEQYQFLQVSKATNTQIRIANRTKVELRTRIYGVKTEFNSCGTEQNGIEVSGTSSKIKMTYAAGYTNPGAGLLLSGLAPGAKIKILKYYGIENGAAIAVENSAVGSRLGRSGISIDNPLLIDNGVGIQVVGSDGIRVRRANVIANAETSSGSIGITLDASSNRNLISKSVWDDRSGTGTSEVDAGTGNCGHANQGFGFPSCH